MTSTIIVFDPIASGIFCDDAPDAVAIPFTIMVEPFTAETDGFTVMLSTVLATATV
jgi:hypothetical protein